ncbi:hypothetical protein FRC20_000369 [Serendipita sp. 405]|nr:hypothetical protein FRC20_000369 [Serendipita sp. 405]
MSHLQDIANTPLSRKRTRADSSPSFGDFSPIGIEDLEELNKLEASFTQQSSPLAKKRKSTPTKAVGRPAATPAINIQPSNKFSSKDTIAVPTPSKQDDRPISRSRPPLDIKTVQAKGKEKPEPFDEFDGEYSKIDANDLPSESDYDSWFQPSVSEIPTFVSFTRPTIGSSGVAPKIIQPSAAAMNAAKKLFEDVEAAEKAIAQSGSEDKPTSEASKPQVAKPVFQPPKPRLSLGSKSTQVPSSTPSTSYVTPAATPMRSIGPHASQRTYVYHSSHPANKSSENTSGLVLDSHESLTETPVRNSRIPESPASVPKHLGMRSRPRGPQKSKFSTPWKQGANPPASTTTPSTKPPAPPKEGTKAATSLEIPTPSSKRKPIVPLAHSVFDLNHPDKRHKLRDQEPPRKRPIKEMVDMGIPAAVGDIETWNAIYWAFEEEGRQLGVDAAFTEMQRLGCTLLERAWLENHWSFVIWKLANTVAIWPSTQAERWSFREVLDQLLYRYEREINRCQRPAVRLIQERDATPSSAMILCVYGITHPSAKQAATVMPDVVLTDGWYQIRAQVDATLARAVKKGKIRVGTKLEIIGARLDAHKKDADEVLKSFDSSSIIITGNGTHLAPWHATLGFVQRPSIPTLRSLTHDGGNVPFTFVTIDEVLPLAFIETVEGGERVTRDETEEEAARAAWEKSRSKEEVRLRDELCKRMEKIEGLIERVERLAGAALEQVRKSEDSPPDHIDAMMDDFEDAEDVKPLLKALTRSDAAWLAITLHRKQLKQQESMRADIESDLTSSFPSRDVRSIRVVKIRDARTTKATDPRTAQVTIWNAEEMGKDALVKGKTYMVTNLIPTLPKGWTKSEVYLRTRKDTTWRKISFPTSAP